MDIYSIPVFLRVIIAIVLPILFVVLLSVPYGTFAKAVCYWTQKPRKSKSGKLVQPYLDKQTVLKCYIPLWQTVKVQQALYNKCSGTKTVAIITAALFVFRLIFSILPTINLDIYAWIYLFSVYGVWLALLMYWALYAVVTFKCACMFNMNLVVKVGCIVLPFIFCLYIKSAIPHVMDAIRKAETFKDDNTATIVKRKSR